MSYLYTIENQKVAELLSKTENTSFSKRPCILGSVQFINKAMTTSSSGYTKKLL